MDLQAEAAARLYRRIGLGIIDGRKVVNPDLDSRPCCQYPEVVPAVLVDGLDQGLLFGLIETIILISDLP